MKLFYKVFLSIVIVFAFLSCSQNENFLFPEETTDILFSVKEKGRSMSYQTWQEELNFNYKGEGKQRLESQNLRMVSYTLTNGIIKGREAVEQPMSRQALFPVYNDSLDINKFLIKSLNDIEKTYLENPEEYYGTRKALFLNDYLDYDLKIVDIEWEYDGIKFNTECLVTDNACVYDDLLSNMRYIVVEEKNKEELPDFILMRKTLTESSDGRRISLKAEDQSITIYSSSGVVGASASIFVFLEGTDYGNGVKSIDDARYNAPHYANTGFYSDGAVKATKQDMGKNGVFGYAFAIGVGTRPINIGWQGSGYIISGQEKGFPGGRTVTANSLN